MRWVEVTDRQYINEQLAKAGEVSPVVALHDLRDDSYIDGADETDSLIGWVEVHPAHILSVLGSRNTKDDQTFGVDQLEEAKEALLTAAVLRKLETES
jgi:hypothetical protein